MGSPAAATPNPSNQYWLATWAVSASGKETILSLQTLGVSAAYLGIYRVTNAGEGSSPVTVNTDTGQFSLQPGTSIDVSSQSIVVVSQGQAAQGTYGLICCATATVPVTQQTKAADTTSLFASSFDPLVFLNGGFNGGNVDGNGTQFDPLTFPE